MSKRTKYGRKLKSKSAIPYSKRNYQLFAVAILILFIGYWALAQKPVDGFLTLSLAPILLVIGYCVLIPLAILYSAKSKSKEQDK